MTRSARSPSAHSTVAMVPTATTCSSRARPFRGGKDITLTLVFAHAGRVSVVAQVTDPSTGGSTYFLN